MLSLSCMPSASTPRILNLFCFFPPFVPFLVQCAALNYLSRGQTLLGADKSNVPNPLIVKLLCLLETIAEIITVSCNFARPFSCTLKANKNFEKGKSIIVSTILDLISSPIWSRDRLVAYRTKGQEIWNQSKQELSLVSSPKRPGRAMVTSNLLLNGYRGLFPQGQRGRSVMLNTYLSLVLTLIILGAVPPILSIFFVYYLLKHLNLTNLTNLFYKNSSHKSKHVLSMSFTKFSFLKYSCHL
jgi:hypothetical protein